MFEIGSSYWFTLKSDRKDVVNIKGKVIEENSFMIKIVRDSGDEDIIPLVRIINVNKPRETEAK